VNAIAAVPPDPTPDEIAGAPPIQRPSQTETALELPDRLWVSPNAGVSWRHRQGTLTSHGRTELWHTRVVPADAPAYEEPTPFGPTPLRAIWSPDFDLQNPPLPDTKDSELGRTAMSANDRHQLVILTSAFHGFEVDSEVIVGLNPALRVIAGPRIAGHYKQPFVPTPFNADLLMLSTLGGWLRSRGQWDPPDEVAPARQIIDVPRVFALSDARLERLSSRASLARPAVADPLHTPYKLDLSEWVHLAAGGRDHYVRIVYEGELKPFGHGAALVKVSERKFVEQDGVVGAYLFQRMFVVVREFEKTFGKDERAMPFKRVRLTTLVTPDIADPSTAPSKVPASLRSFWVDVHAADGTVAHFPFHAVGTDIAGNRVDFTVPMMFVSRSETNRPTVIDAYNDPGEIDLRDAVVPGQSVTFAEPAAAAPAGANLNTQLVTRAMNFVVDRASEQPSLLKADVGIPQVQELLGADAMTTIRYFADYVNTGFDAETGVYAELAEFDPTRANANPANPAAGVVASTLRVGFRADRAGGIATPNVGLSTLTQRAGPLAGKVGDAVSGTFDPGTFFGGGIAELFGTFDLASLAVGGTVDAAAPKMQTNSAVVGGQTQIVTTFAWTSDVKSPISAGPVTFEKGPRAQLDVHGTVTKLVNPDGSSQSTFTYTGSLTDFRVAILGSVTVKFTAFTFAARSREKPNVAVNLDTGDPIEFSGDLEFVDQLRRAIPPGLFGDGPSLDLTADGIRAGFGVALPPVEVGVFGLSDVRLAAALTLPFTDGKPVLDFNVSERAHPFVVAVMIFGGGGFFHLQLDTAGMKELEAALEFGATASLDIGVASGSVHMMAGIYFSLQRRDDGTLRATLAGYLRVGGSLSVLGLITVSVEFNLTFAYVEAGKAYGRATLTVEVEVAFFSKSVELTVERTFGGSSGDPSFSDQFTKTTWKQYALAYA
jgi:hypothetical protein